MKLLFKIFSLILFIILYSNSNFSLQLPASRQYLYIVGSTAIFPYSVIIADHLQYFAKHPAPIIEANGTGIGFKLFCSGPGLDTPDLVNASRQMHDSEFELCQQNGVKDIQEHYIGSDAIVLIQPTNFFLSNLTSEEIFLAVSKFVPVIINSDLVIPQKLLNVSDANLKSSIFSYQNLPGSSFVLNIQNVDANITHTDLVKKLIKDKNIIENMNIKLIHNPYKLWSEINPKLPAVPIKIFGPSVSSGTYDIFVEHFIGKFLSNFVNLSLTDLVRKDGHYIDTIDSPNIIIQKVINNRYTLGVISYNFLISNTSVITAVAIDGIKPTSQSIAMSQYPLTRKLYVYSKPTTISGIKDYIMQFLSNSYLKDFGLIYSKPAS